MGASITRIAITVWTLALLLLAAVPLAAQPAQAWAASPGRAAVSSVASKAPGQVTVAVKKAKGAKGYQYWASTSKRFDKAKRYGLVSAKSPKRSATLKGLPEGKRCFVKVRAYAGKRYGKWSAAKSVKVRKSTALADAKAEAAKSKKALASAKEEASKAKSEASKRKKEADDAKAEAARYKTAYEEIAPITIAYDADGGTLPPGAKTKLEKGEGAYTLPTPSRKGYNFEGWFTKAGKRVTAVSHADGSVSVRARWSEAKLAYVYVDAGRRSAETTAWDEATRSYLGIKLYELYIVDSAAAPETGARYKGGTVVAAGGKPDGGSYPAGSIALLAKTAWGNLELPDKGECTAIDLHNADTSAVTDMSGMFEGCSSLETLDVSGWDTSNVAGMDSMFRDCPSLASLDVSGWDTSAVAGMGYMFSGCSLLASLETGAEWTTGAATGSKPYFPRDMHDELGALHSSGSDIPDGAHTYTAEKQGGLSAGSAGL